MTAVERFAIVMERASRGGPRPLEVAAWHRPADEVETALLAGLRGPVLDIGCGPGRIVAALAGSGVPALGIDVAPSALALARDTGAPVLDRSVFGRLPGEGRWMSCLLLDGNVGIGGDPVRLLRRVGAALHPDGAAVVEVDPPGSPTECDQVRLREPGARPGPWFPWAWVGADDLPSIATDAGFASAAVRERAGRHFATLTGPSRCRTPVLR